MMNRPAIAAGRVALHLRAAGHGQDEGLADRLQHGVGGEQEEDVQHQEDRGDALSAAHLREDAEDAVE